MTFSKEREKLVQLTARHEKLKEELSQQKKEVMDKSRSKELQPTCERVNGRTTRSTECFSFFGSYYRDEMFVYILFILYLFLD